MPNPPLSENDCNDRIRASARRAYESYLVNSGGLNFRGEKCPDWDALTTEVRSHWCAAIAPEAILLISRENYSAGLEADVKRLGEDLADVPIVRGIEGVGEHCEHCRAKALHVHVVTDAEVGAVELARMLLQFARADAARARAASLESAG